MIQAGKLRDAKSIAGLLYYFRFLSPIVVSSSRNNLEAWHIIMHNMQLSGSVLFYSIGLRLYFC